MRNTAMY